MIINKRNECSEDQQTLNIQEDLAQENQYKGICRISII